MKKILSTLALALSSFCLQAQDITHSTISFGVRGGLNSASIVGSDDMDLTRRTGFHAGPVLNANFSWKHALQLEAVYSQKGYQLETGSRNGTVMNKYQLNYIDVPLLYRYNVMARRRQSYKTQGADNTLYIFAGPQFSSLLTANRKTEAAGNNSPDSEPVNQNATFKSRMKSFETSAVIGLGYNFINNTMLSVRYNHGLSKIENNQYLALANARNSVLQLSLSYLIPVN